MDWSSIALLALICIAIGFFTGRLFSSLDRQVESGKPDEPGEEVIKIRRDGNGENFSVEIDGLRYRRAGDLGPQVHKKINKAIIELNRWFEPDYSVPAPKSPADETPSPARSPDELLQEQKSRRSFSPVKMITDALQADVQKSKLPNESFIQQIDDILQEKLKAAPVTEAVRLMEWPGKGMVVMVGLDQYQEIEDIPDEEIKTVIRSAVKEWEQRGEEPRPSG